jgi:hypothetical protein
MKKHDMRIAQRTFTPDEVEEIALGVNDVFAQVINAKTVDDGNVETPVNAMPEALWVSIELMAAILEGMDSENDPNTKIRQWFLASCVFDFTKKYFERYGTSPLDDVNNLFGSGERPAWTGKKAATVLPFTKPSI